MVYCRDCRTFSRWLRWQNSCQFFVPFPDCIAASFGIIIHISTHSDMCVCACTIFLIIYLHEIRKRKANWIGHVLRRNCILQQIIEGKIKGQIEVTRRGGRRRKRLLDGLKDRRGYCRLKDVALDRTIWRNRFGRDFGPVVWQITNDDDDDIYMYVDVYVYKYILPPLRNKTVLYFCIFKKPGYLN